MIRTLASVIAIWALSLSSPAWSYGVYGHETVVRIAMANVSPATRTKALAMLRRAKVLDTAPCSATTPEKASVWPDCIRNLSDRFSYSGPWHYQNIDICRPFDLKPACRDGNCVSAQIERQVKLLRNRTVPEREKVAALAFLIHFVGDLHMPLHAGDRGDRGGNDVKAAYGIYRTSWLDLHGIWDTPLAERAASTPPSLIRGYTAAERASIAAGGVEDWSRESWTVSRNVAYALALGGDPCGPKPTAPVTLSDAAIEQAIAPQRDQITRAGLRLARLMDEAFDPAGAFTPRPRD